jgi:hypothetical protein
MATKLSGWQETHVPEPRTKQERITEADMVGLKYFDRLAPLLGRLRDVGCERDRAGNRELHFDQYCMLILLYLFNPIVTSLRGLQQASELAKVQKRLGCSRAALGSLSESVTVFDPERLQEIVLELGAELKPLERDPRLKSVPGTLAAVDGTLLSALPGLMQASLLKQTTGSGLVKWRLHTHFEDDRGVPTRIEVTPDGGAHDERAVLERTVQGDHTYVMDRGYAKFALFNAIVAVGSSYVCRLRDNSNYRVLESRPLTDADRKLNVISDERIEIGLHGKPEARPDHQIRLITVRISQHTSRGKYRGGSTGPSSDGLLRIATNLLDVPAETIALIYIYRWTIEVCQADCISRYTLYQARGSAHSERCSVVGAGTMEPDTQAIEPRRTAMRRLNVRLGAPPTQTVMVALSA